MVRSVTTPQVAQHSNPVPNAAIHRGLMITSGILGKVLATGKYPVNKDQQVALAFDYLVEILSAGGADLQDVVKLDLFFANKEDRVLANHHWLRLNPDETRRPARQAHQVILPEDCCIQIVATAMLKTQPE